MDRAWSSSELRNHILGISTPAPSSASVDAHNFAALVALSAPTDEFTDSMSSLGNNAIAKARAQLQAQREEEAAAVVGTVLHAVEQQRNERIVAIRTRRAETKAAEAADQKALNALERGLAYAAATDIWGPVLIATGQISASDVPEDQRSVPEGWTAPEAPSEG